MNKLIHLLTRIRYDDPPFSLKGWERSLLKLQAFWGFTAELARLSTCNRLHVGSCLIRSDFSGIAAVGYNGPPRGIDNAACRNSKGSCGCIHAEANSLMKLVFPETGLTLLTTLAPCEHCAGLIVNSARVDAVVYGDEYRDPTGLNIIQHSGVMTVQINEIAKYW